jgi:hypothetical protein
MLMLLPVSSLAQEAGFTSEQLALRSEIFNFIRQEGFVPELDSDGDIKFKSEGFTHYIVISKSDSSPKPMYLTMYRSFNYPENYSQQCVVLATRNLNLYKGIKVVCFDDSFRIGAEMFVRDAESFTSVFYRLRDLIGHATEDFLDECKAASKEYGSTADIGLPFIFTNVEVANCDENNNVVQDFGSTIWDFKTMYLTPRITIKPLEGNGTHKLYIKFYKGNELRSGSSSPEGYSYSSEVTISGTGEQVITLSGWGSSTAGHWPMGKYRFEFWYGDYCIGSKTFNVN